MVKFPKPKRPKRRAAVGHTIPDYQAKYAYLIRRQRCRCAICGGVLDPLDKVDLHHARTHNDTVARRRYPLFVHSVYNLQVAHNRCNVGSPSSGKWPERKVAWYERRLQTNPAMADIDNYRHTW